MGDDRPLPDQEGLSAGQAYLENSLTLGSFQLQSRTDSQGVRHLTLFSQESSS